MRRLTRWMVPWMAAASLALGGCLFFQSASISDSAGKGGNPVHAEASDMGWLMLVVPQNLTQAAADQLVSQCASAKISDVQTELKVRNWFGIVQVYDATANGACL